MPRQNGAGLLRMLWRPPAFHVQIQCMSLPLHVPPRTTGVLRRQGLGCHAHLKVQAVLDELPCSTLCLLCRLATFCAHIAASLPFLHADEPLLLLYHINQLIARHGEEALAALRASLEGRGTAAQVASAAGNSQSENQLADGPEHADGMQVLFYCAAKCPCCLQCWSGFQHDPVLLPELMLGCK